MNVWIRVDSTNVKKYRYLSASKVLEIVFINAPSKIYGYRDVPFSVVKAFETAESKGSYVRTSLEKRYSFTVYAKESSVRPTLKNTQNNKNKPSNTKLNKR